MKKVLFTILSIGLLFLQAKAQENTLIQQINIGEKVPDKVWKSIPKSKEIRLVILDQWSIWCASCVAAFPKMEVLQEKFGKELQIVLVTKNSQQEIDSKPNIKKRLPNLPSITSDSVFSSLFPYVMVPQHVWINQDGIIEAITSGENTTAENIENFLKGKTIELSTKNDLSNFDYKKPLFTSDVLPTKQVQAYSILIKGKVGLKGGNTFRRNDDTIHGRAITNTNILAMYRIAAREILPGLNSKRIILEVKDPSKLEFDNKNHNRDDWNKENLYSYDLILPVSDSGRLYEYMLQDLNRYSEYHGRIEKRQTPCLVLVRTSKKDKIKSAGGKKENTIFQNEDPVLKNYPLSYLIMKINGLETIKVPVVDETGYTENVDIRFKGNIQDLKSLNKELKRYSLDLIEAERELEMFVLSDKTRPIPQAKKE